MSTTGGTEPVWSRDGRELFYRNGTAMFSVRIDVNGARFVPGSPELLFEGPYATDPIVGVNPNYDVASDGRFLMVQPGAGTGDVAPEQIILVLNWLEELKRLVPVD